MMTMLLQAGGAGGLHQCTSHTLLQKQGSSSVSVFIAAPSDCGRHSNGTMRLDLLLQVQIQAVHLPSGTNTFVPKNSIPPTGHWL